jgi:hypothetical protein
LKNSLRNSYFLIFFAFGVVIEFVQSSIILLQKKLNFFPHMVTKIDKNAVLKLVQVSKIEISLNSKNAYSYICPIQKKSDSSPILSASLNRFYEPLLKCFYSDFFLYWEAILHLIGYEDNLHVPY